MVFQWFWGFEAVIVERKSNEKLIQKRSCNLNDFRDGFLIDFWSILERIWDPTSIKIQDRNEIGRFGGLVLAEIDFDPRFSSQNPGCWSQRPPKELPNGFQNGAKLEGKAAKKPMTKAIPIYIGLRDDFSWCWKPKWRMFLIRMKGKFIIN